MSNFAPLLSRLALAAAFVGGSAAVAAAQVYAEPVSEPMVEWSSTAPAISPAWSGHDDRRAYRAARVQRIATPHVATRNYVAPALPPVAATAYTLPTRVIYAEPAPRAIYYNEPVVIDGLRTHRAARRVMLDPCGYGCVRSAY